MWILDGKARISEMWIMKKAKRDIANFSDLRQRFAKQNSATAHG